MRFVWVFAIPAGLVVLLIVGAPSMLNLDDDAPDPDKIITLHTKSGYDCKAEGYAARGRKQKALDTCAAMELEHGESSQDLCLLRVYDRLDDIDGKIEVQEKRLARKLAS
ncbi:MAG: hypothetical protein WA947_09010 [Phormidesmis sp.]